MGETTLREENLALRALVKELRDILEEHQNCSRVVDGHGVCAHCFGSEDAHHLTCRLRIALTKDPIPFGGTPL